MKLAKLSYIPLLFGLLTAGQMSCQRRPRGIVRDEGPAIARTESPRLDSPQPIALDLHRYLRISEPSAVGRMTIGFSFTQSQLFSSFKVFIRQSGQLIEQSNVINLNRGFALSVGNQYYIVATLVHPNSGQQTMATSFDLTEITRIQRDGLTITFWGERDLYGERIPAITEVAAQKVTELNRLLMSEFRINQLDIWLTPALSLEEAGQTSNVAIHASASFNAQGKLPIVIVTPEDNRPDIPLLEKLADVITHEFGHWLHMERSFGEFRETFIDRWIDFYLEFASRRYPQNQYFLDNCQESNSHVNPRCGASIISLFTDREYFSTSDTISGHPWSDDTELFASVFMITRNHHHELWERIRTSGLPAPQKALARRIINAVR